MAEEIDDSGFYRQDFSTVSDWEVFNAQLGDVIQKLNAIEIDVSNEVHTFGPNWKVHTETFLLHTDKISVSLYCSVLPREADDKENKANNSMYDDLMNVKSIFGPPLKSPDHKGLHAISNLFGLRRFAVIHPHQSNQKYINKPSEFCFFLSAATVVAAEYCRMVPMFVQIYDPKLNIFLGVGMNATLRTNFDVVVLKQSPLDCRYLSGLLQIFKEKLPRSNVQPISVSVRNMYALPTKRFRYAMNVPFFKSFNETNDAFEDKDISSEKYLALPCGYFPDSETEVYLDYSWLDISENSAIDSSLYTDFVPSKAPNCNMYQRANAISYLTSCLRDFLKLYDNKETLDAFFGRIVTDSSDGVNMAAALQHLTDPHIRNIRSNNKLNIKESSQNLKKIAGPLNESELRSFIAFIFPDLYPDIEINFYTNDMSQKNEFDPHRIKSSPINSLACRLSCILATCNAHFGGKSGFAQLWIAFIRELRFIWNSRLSIQGISGGFPDTRTCLLNQKLQMLNYCIERSKCQKYDNKNHSSDMDKTTPQGAKVDEKSFKEISDETGDEDEDEFFDCAEYVPEGRDKRLGNENILGSNEPLYIPITQDPVPKTEDHLHADAEAMLKLGSGSGLNIQMMSSSLLSDMEAFKAANPKGKMEDFIRWYSPKDWETDDSGMAQLSARMRVPENTWQTVWKQAQPVPASKQKRLFDETTEALNVLSYLETRNVGEIYDLVIITVLHAAIIKFKTILENERILDIFESKIEALLADLCHISRDDEIIGAKGCDIQQTKSKFEDLIKKLEEYEVQFFQYKCFEQLTGYPGKITLEKVKNKFKEIIENSNRCSLYNSEGIGKHIVESNGGELCSNLIMKEYVLRVNMAAGPHFLRAIVTGEEVRLCGAFTENTTLI
ncbi:rab3 GTPase-activating protein catalytic subunit [Zeugodacus cucurbitae]|uniref:rab3 GTPase-activating protein catalytic subunit n=1 Tax=Zeugodacus cucurbitae TaxID=28588 RepID=UPI0023D8E82E|nr:rab3 GTPase-activating protein catalytic subunit [Zeugodacus cucurbitae]